MLTLLCDNISAVMVPHDPVLHARTEHIELDIHFARERVTARKLCIQHVPGTTQIADALTKPLSHAGFQEFKNKLKVVPIQHP